MARRRLRNEVALAFVVKLAALFALYLLFFDQSRAPPKFDALDGPAGQYRLRAADWRSADG